MSQEAKDKFDFWSKVAMMVLISIASYFFKHMADQFDRVQSTVEDIGTRVGVSETRINNLKDEVTEVKADVKYLQRRNETTTAPAQ
jgi:cell division protein FtsB